MEQSPGRGDSLDLRKLPAMTFATPQVNKYRRDSLNGPHTPDYATVFSQLTHVPHIGTHVPHTAPITTRATRQTSLGIDICANNCNDEQPFM
ncbi:hypothetical protein ACQ86D_24945 [Streptomyces galilaeus]